MAFNTFNVTGHLSHRYERILWLPELISYLAIRAAIIYSTIGSCLESIEGHTGFPTPCSRKIRGNLRFSQLVKIFFSCLWVTLRSFQYIEFIVSKVRTIDG